MDGMLGTASHNSAAHQNSEILSTLTQVGANTTVLVLENADDRSPAFIGLHNMMHDICWDLTGAMHELKPADLAYWSETETLYTGAEFATAASQPPHGNQVTKVVTKTSTYPIPAVHEPFQNFPTIDAVTQSAGQSMPDLDTRPLPNHGKMTNLFKWFKPDSFEGAHLFSNQPVLSKACTIGTGCVVALKSILPNSPPV